MFYVFLCSHFRSLNCQSHKWFYPLGAHNQFENGFLISLIVFVVYVIFQQISRFYFSIVMLLILCPFLLFPHYTHFDWKKKWFFLLIFRHHSLNDTKQKKKTTINRNKKETKREFDQMIPSRPSICSRARGPCRVRLCILIKVYFVHRKTTIRFWFITITFHHAYTYIFTHKHNHLLDSHVSDVHTRRFIVFNTYVL